jgi:hypothetical protein
MHAKLHEVPLVAGKRYLITLDAAGPAKGPGAFQAFDPFLVVQDGGGKTLAFDDDSGAISIPG